MKYLLIFLSIIAFDNVAIAQEEMPVTKIYIVRHAEKESGNDPALTLYGNKRAGDLMRTLQSEKIQKIYVSQFRRTQMTADSLRIQFKIDTVHYVADTACYNLLNAIMEHGDFGKTILIIAHSNTIPKIIHKLGVLDYPVADIPDNDFDDLFLVTYKNENARIKKIKYGAKSGVSATMQ